MWIIQKRVWKRLDIPGPRGLPVIGNAFQMISQTPYVQLHEWSKRHGNVFKIQMFNEEIVVLSENDVMREALLEKSEDFAGRPFSWRINFVTPGGDKDITFRDLSQDLKRVKKIAHRGLKQFGDGMDRIAILASDEIQDCISRFQSHGNTPFDPRESVDQCITNIMTVLLVGEQIDKSSHEFQLVCDLVKSMERCGSGGLGAELDMFPWLRYFGNESFEILKEHKSIREKLFSDWMNTAEKKLSLHSDETRSRSVCEVFHQHYKQGEI
ncbi:unnamed protein product, partial [Owenia fusiformis]